MKRILATALLCVGSQAHAVLLGSQSEAIGCGPTMRTATIDQMKASLGDANAKVLQHFTALNRDLGERRKNPATDAAIAETDRMAQELGSLIDIMQADDGLKNALDGAALLAAIREQTVYGGDKIAVNARLSAQLYAARQEAEKAFQYINPALAKITSSGVASEAAKFRDTVAAVVRVLGSCKAPG
jgi:hypothetical protein